MERAKKVIDFFVVWFVIMPIIWVSLAFVFGAASYFYHSLTPDPEFWGDEVAIEESF